MIETVRIRVRPDEYADSDKLKQLIEAKYNQPVNDWKIIRKSIDARQRQIWIDMDCRVASGNDTTVNEEIPFIDFKKLPADAPQVVIVGAGPAGLFAALKAIELGWRPIVLERGKPVEERLHDIVRLQKEGELDPNSNFCFGEGGAGAFSDGKLFTRSKKRGDVKGVLAILVQHGAGEEIMYEAHPHIGSDKLPRIIKAIRETIIASGGIVRFSTTFASPIIEDGKVTGAKTTDGEVFKGPVILATGHSARDVIYNLHHSGIRLQAKGFAMGVRLEHPQTLIDSIVYHSPLGRGNFLPPAEYSLTAQVDGRGVYSFCMCPGGVIVPAASAKGESVVNGMSASGRSGKWANSGMVVEIRPEDFPEYDIYGDLKMLKVQEDAERKFFNEKPGYNVPAQRMKDFIAGRKSADLPKTSYVPGLHSVKLDSLLPPHISERLKKGFLQFDKKHRGFLTNDATMIGLESRTSSPVRIPRDEHTMHHPDFEGFYPVGEGAGYAGGIVSAAMDGIRSMEAIDRNYNSKSEKS